MTGPEVSIEDILAARERLRGQIVDTPLLHSRTLSEIAGCDLYLKFENLQFTASFKERGAGNRLIALSPQERKAGVIAVSAGNHAQGVAYHARRLGIRALIVMPKLTPYLKVENTQRLGAEVVLAGDSLAQARLTMLGLARENGYQVVHPYDDPYIIAGQGTLGLDMLERMPDLDTLVVAIGGGGLIAGIATAARHLKPGLEIIGVQSQLFPAAYAAFCAAGGAPAAAASIAPDAALGGPTIAEGIAVEQPGLLTMPVICKHVKRIALVSEAEIERAIVLLLEIEKTVVEGAGAAGLAAVLAQPESYRGKKVGLVLCGGNIDTLTLADIVQRSLVRSRRLARLSVSTRDAPGSLARVAAIIGDQGANIEEVTHQRAFADLPVRYVRIDLVISTRGEEHLRAVVQALGSAGFDSHVVNS